MATPESGRCAATVGRAFHAAEAAGERIFLQDRLGPLSYGETCARIRRLAGLFRAWDLRPGQRVLLAAREDRTVAVAFLALLRCGHPVILLDPATGPERARALLAVGSPAAFLLDRDLIDAWGVAAEPRVLALTPEERAGAGERHPPQRWAGRETYPDCLRGLAPAELPAEPEPGEDAYILFTSGTTEQPKGVCIPQAALFAHLASLGRAFGYDPGSVLFNSLPLSHADGLVQGPVIAFAHGMTLLRPFPFQIQTVNELLDALDRHRATHLVATPTMLALLERTCGLRRSAFLTGWFRFVISCTATLEADLWQRFEATFGVPVANLYGLTETVTGGLLAGPEPDSRRHGTIGRPLDCEARIVAIDGSPCADGQPGELQVRGANRMRCYLGAPAASARVLDAEGWLSTGDLARREPDGLYRILGRLKALIVRGGSKIHPEEVTETLHAHPGVLAAVTFGHADPIWGELVFSALQAAPGAGLDEAALTAFCRTRLEEHKVPSRIFFLPELPRTRSGKVLLAEVQARVQALLEAPGPGPDPAEAVAQGVLAEAAAAFRVPVELLDLEASPLTCPGWDSLAHLGFIEGLETRFGIRLEPEDIVAIDRLGAAVEAVVARQVAP